MKNVENDAARAALHGIVAAALTQLAGGNGADGLKAGAAGAVTASLLSERLVSALYDKDVSQLTADEKWLVSNLVSIAGAGIGYAAGGEDVSLAAVGANTARVEVENNSISTVINGGKLAAQTCAKMSACRDKLTGAGLGALLGVGASTSAMDALSKDEQMNLIYVASLNDPSLLSQLNDAQKAAYESLTGKTITSTGGTQVINPGPTNTGGDQTVTGNVPSNTGNNDTPTGEINHTGNTEGGLNSGGFILINPGVDPLAKKDIVYLSENSSNNIDNVINETLAGKKNFTSSTTLTTDEALAAGLKFLGPGYKEIGKPGSGVYHSADGTKEFRIDSASIDGAHAPGVPHVHFGVKNPENGKYIANNHVPYKN
ncbi:VENN motif pre-toxin domain-containing protein [uncultured Leclercia sp.]|uniref:VENN motif pre-toxin domain-containing protein n=1 Tax=uncultured Leclercia sp. TaxID=332959 RepID=UPI002597684D|nr:VENN motif pre-toxin domain-containing protein [uncultured Leclercia sp.]